VYSRILAGLGGLLLSGLAHGAEPVVGDPEIARAHLIRMGLSVPADLVDAVGRGEALFFTERFGGNGRTCGTCHPKENNLTLDRAFVAALPPDDPLFVAEFDAALAELERPDALRARTLIVEDTVDQFLGGLTPNRTVPHMFGLALTTESNRTTPPLENTGSSGDGSPGDGTLRSFPIGAVIQHFTRTLARVEGVDFRLPTEAELDDLFLFMISLGPATLPDLQNAQFVHEKVRRGLAQFMGPGKCNLCHLNAGAEITIPGFQDNLIDTGVEALRKSKGLPRDGGFGVTPDGLGGFGDGRFASPPLLFAADTPPFFHNGGAQTLKAAISFYNSRAFKNSPGNQAVVALDPLGAGIRLQIGPLAALLSVLNALENGRSARRYLERSLAHAQPHAVLEMAGFELEDAVRVLKTGGVHRDAGDRYTQAGLHVQQARAGFSAGLVTQAIAEIDAARALMITD
jgi:hypothetical protein